MLLDLSLILITTNIQITTDPISSNHIIVDLLLFLVQKSKTTHSNFDFDKSEICISHDTF